MNKTIMIIGIIILTPIVLWAAFWIAFAIGVYTQPLPPDPPNPAITYGEFPVRVEIEHNGEKIVKEDSIICEYKGIVTRRDTGMVGKYREWNIEGGNAIPIFYIDEFAIHYVPGNAGYYMDDPEFGVFRTNPKPPQLKIRWNPDLGFATEEEALEHFGIKIISVKETPPIKNTFK